MTIQIVILAAGQGKRMNSKQPKVLHGLAGKPILEHIIRTAIALEPDAPPIVVYGHEGSAVRQKLGNLPVRWVEQRQQLGTGHALQQALTELDYKNDVLVLYGDVPLTSASTLKNLLAQTPARAIGIITALLDNPQGYGRIKRNAAKKITGIVEDKDANLKERKIREINTGIYLLPIKFLKKALPKIRNHNRQGEFYLPDVIKQAVKERIRIHSIQPAAIEEILGVNDRLQLAQLERYYQRWYAEKLLLQGVTLVDPARFDVRGDVRAGHDVYIDINVICEGLVAIGDGCTIGANCILRNVILGERVEVKPNSIIDGAEIGADCIIGPYARIRPDTRIAANAHVGNFVEIKKSQIGKGTKINHLSYIGDSEIGMAVNIGAGTITCNYDGARKHKTTIGDNAFIGSNTELVAPVTVGAGATIGAGSTITKDAPPGKLTLTRAVQTTVEHWERPRKKEIE